VPMQGSIIRRAGSFCIAGWMCFLAHYQVPNMQEEHKLLAPLFIKNGQMTSILTLRNDGKDATQVHVGLNSLEGEVVGHRVLSVASHSESRVDLDAVQMLSHRFEDLGSIEVTADGETISGWVTIETRKGTATRVLDEPLQLATVWPELAAAKISHELISVPVLAVHNWSTSPQLVSIDCSPGLLARHRKRSRSTAPATARDS
jgi:hypothetical protein